MNTSTIVSIVAFLIVVVGGLWFFDISSGVPVVTTFDECVKQGGLLSESYPRQCQYSGKTFTELTGIEPEKYNLIRVNTPSPNQTVSSPLTVTGEARGNWFFEASFPIVVTDWDGRIIGQGIAQAEGEWMTTEFVPFKSVITFTVDKDAYSNRGSLILRKDNPTGLPEYDDALEIPILLAN